MVAPTLPSEHISHNYSCLSTLASARRLSFEAVVSQMSRVLMRYAQALWREEVVG